MTASHLNLKWTVADTDIMRAAALRDHDTAHIAFIVYERTGKGCTVADVESVLTNAGLRFRRRSA